MSTEGDIVVGPMISWFMIERMLWGHLFVAIVHGQWCADIRIREERLRNGLANGEFKQENFY